MRSHGVVVDTPTLDQDDCFLQGIEDLAVEKLVPELAGKALVLAILPR